MVLLVSNGFAQRAKKAKSFADLKDDCKNSRGSVTAVFCTIIREESGDSAVTREFGWIVRDFEFSVAERQPRDVSWGRSGQTWENVSSKFGVAEIDSRCEICPYAEVEFLINGVFD